MNTTQLSYPAAQSNRASAHVDEAKHSANSAVGGLVSAAKSLGGAAVQAGKSVATRSRAGK